MKISEKIYRLRTEYNLTQAQLAKIAGVSDKAVSTWELGTKEPRMKSTQKICSHFHIDLNQFVDVESDVYKNEQLAPDYDKLFKEVVMRLVKVAPDSLMQDLIKLSPSDLEKVGAFVQGLLASH